MTTRTYDYILTVSEPDVVHVGDTIFSNLSETTGEVVAVDAANANIKVKVANVNQEFIVDENARSVFMPVLQVTLPLLSTFASTSLKVSISAGASLSVLNDRVFSKTQVFGAVNCALIFPLNFPISIFLLCGFHCLLIIDNDLLLLVNKSF